ncbi:50S ribosomal protein L5 [Candidatus Micrarchaeota archaeon]|nr:50S ribosomal protein L5 [Candidatus Micrarchaeota archaeon]
MAKREVNKKKNKKENPMRKVRIKKVTLNIGVGQGGEPLEMATALLEKITGMKPVKTKAKVRNPTWKLRKGLQIGAKVTLRGKKAEEILKKSFKAVDDKISSKAFDKFGNFSFGVKEYIDFPGIKYDPNIGIMGFDVCVTLDRPGYRINKRKRMKSKIGKSHLLNKDEAIDFVRSMGVEVL